VRTEYVPASVVIIMIMLPPKLESRAHWRAAVEETGESRSNGP
jgi:hypothetical protein